MKTTPLKVGGREFALAFNMNSMAEMEEKIQDFSLDKLNVYVRSSTGMLTMIEILAREGEEIEGRQLDVDAKWFGRHMSPSVAVISRIQVALFDALRIGLSMENEEDDKDREVDVVLKEMKKKAEPTG